MAENFPYCTMSELENASSELLRGVGQRIRLVRKLKGYSQDDLASRANVSRRTLAEIEATGKCTFETLVHIAIALDQAADIAKLFNSDSLQMRELTVYDLARRAKDFKDFRDSLDKDGLNIKARE